MKNPNHPKAGSTTKVEPFKTCEEIEKIKGVILNPLDMAIFVLGINTNLRAIDILGIRNCQLYDMEVPTSVEDMPVLVLKEKKTGKGRRVSLNADVVKALLAFKEKKDKGLNGMAVDDPFFWGQRGPIGVPALNLKVKTWAKRAGIKGNFGSHSLRKTFGYMKRLEGVDIPTLMTLFNHSSQAQTLEYLCIQPEEIKQAYWNSVG